MPVRSCRGFRVPVGYLVKAADQSYPRHSGHGVARGCHVTPTGAVSSKRRGPKRRFDSHLRCGVGNDTYRVTWIHLAGPTTIAVVEPVVGLVIGADMSVVDRIGHLVRLA